MADDLRNRVLAAVRKGLAGPLDTAKTKKPVLQSYSADSATENGVTAEATCNTAFPNQIKNVTPLHRLSGKGESALPTMAYRATSAEPDGTACEVTIIELPQAQRYRKTFAALQMKSPALVPVERWRKSVRDGSKFLARWAEKAEALGWSSADLFGLHSPLDKPHPSYSRLSRYDETGLVWLLQGREVIALTEATATIRNSDTGTITTYRRFNKPALGPLGDSLDDFDQ